MMPLTKQKGRFEVLDSFRGIAAIIVAVFHYTSDLGSIRNIAIIAHGHRFVDFFFVLSGFIIYLNYASISTFGEQKVFMKKRIWRLYPLHVFMLALFLLFEIFKAILYNYGFFNKMPFTTNSLSSLIPNLLLLQGVVNSSKDFTWNYPSWSISVEMINYMLFVAIMPIVGKFTKSFRPYILIVISALALLLISMDVKPFEFVLKCTYGFFLGCFVLHIYQTKISGFSISSRAANMIEISSMIVIILAICYLPERYAGLLTILYGVVILIFAAENGLISKILKNRFFLLLGTLSYSIYMTHALVANVLKVGFLNVLKVSGTTFDFSTLVFLVVVFLFSQVTYRHIELRAQNFSKKALAPSDKKGLKPIA